MIIQQIRNEIEKMKKRVNPTPNRGILILYNPELYDSENNIIYELIVSIDGWDASKLSKDEIQAMIDKAEVIFCIPDNGRDPIFIFNH